LNVADVSRVNVVGACAAAGFGNRMNAAKAYGRNHLSISATTLG
jgi:hypothetical protein